MTPAAARRPIANGLQDRHLGGAQVTVRLPAAIPQTLAIPGAAPQLPPETPGPTPLVGGRRTPPAACRSPRLDLMVTPMVAPAILRTWPCRGGQRTARH